MIASRQSVPRRYLTSSFFTFLASTAFITLGCRNLQNGQNYNLTDSGNLASIVISPDLNHVPVGAMEQFRAVAAFTDGHSEDFTKFVTWSSSSPHVARVSSTGLAITVADGTTILTASAGRVRDEVQLRVSPATLESQLHQSLPEQYVWSPADGEQDAIRYFRASFQVKRVPSQATLYLAGPKNITAYLNGKLVNIQEELSNVRTNPLVVVTDVSAGLQPGLNLLAVACSTGDRIVGKIVPAPPSLSTQPIMISGNGWKVTTIAEPGWELLLHDDFDWLDAKIIGGVESDPSGLDGGRDSEMYRWAGYDGISPGLARRSESAASVLGVSEGAGHFSNPQILTSPSLGQGFSVRVPQKVWHESDYPSLILDLGRETCGRLEIASDSSDVAKVRIRYGESLQEALLEPFYGENEIILPSRVTVYGPKSGFRYVQIKFVSGPPVLNFKRLAVDEIYYPMGFRGFFNSSDALVNSIWATGARTAQLTMQEGIWDGIKRDRLKWSGDLFVSGRVIQSLFGEPVIIPQTLKFLTEKGLGPRGDINNIPGYSAFWVMTLADYFRHSGDLIFLFDQKTELLAVLKSITSSIDSRGTVTFDPSVFPFVDWSRDLFTDTAETRKATQFVFFKAFLEGAWLLDQLGDPRDADEARNWANTLRSASESLLLESSNTYGPRWQTNSMAIFSGVTNSVQEEAILQNVLSVPSQDEVTPYYNYFVVTAMAQAGRRQQALDWIRKYWGGMLAEGATTFWEAYDLNWPKENFHSFLKADRTQGFYVSLCHGWSSGAAAWLVEQVLGIQPTAAGFGEVAIRPDLADLKWVEGSEPTPTGNISVEYHAGDGLEGMISLPPQVQARLSLPIQSGQTSVSINGRLMPGTPSESGTRLVLVLSHSGLYHFATGR